MKLINTGEASVRPSLVMLVYGEGGVGKTTFSSTAPRPILADCENGSKYFGLRGIKMNVAIIEKWSDMRDFLQIAKSDAYDTIVIDPIGELMDKLKKYMISTGDMKLVQKDGNPTMAGWGWLKKVMRDYLKVLRDSGKHVLLVAHLDEVKDEDRIVKRPQIATKLADDIVNMVDVVAYMTVVKEDGEDKRILIVDPGSDKYTAKDRTGQLGKIIEPDFNKIIEATQGTKTFKWSKAVPVKKDLEQLGTDAEIIAKQKGVGQIEASPEAIAEATGIQADVKQAIAENKSIQVNEENIDIDEEQMKQDEKALKIKNARAKLDAINKKQIEECGK